VEFLIVEDGKSPQVQKFDLYKLSTRVRSSQHLSRADSTGLRARIDLI